MQLLTMRLKFPQVFAVLLIIGALTLGGCTSNTASSSASSTATATSETTTNATTSTKTVSETISESIPGMKDFPRLEGKATVVMTVKGSPITIELDGANAPITAGNFVDLVQKGIYDGLVFHRVVSYPQPFVVQG